MALALVESPAQLLNVLEWARLQPGGQELSILLLPPPQAEPRRQLRAVCALALPVDVSVSWHEVRGDAVSAAAALRRVLAEVRRADQLILGDPFSKMLQLMLTLGRARSVVVVDDGSATIEFAELINRRGDLIRWHHRGNQGLLGRRLAAAARRRLTPGGVTELELFTAMPVAVPGMRVVQNTFEWTRDQFGAPEILPGADLVGTSLVETGVVDLGHYLSAVRLLSQSQGITRYLAHRKESPDKLDQLQRMGLEIVRPDLPLEIFARRGPIGSRIVSFPSTIVHTLPLVLAGAGVELAVCDIDSAWFATGASARSDVFLTTVTALARRTHGLAAVAAA